MSQHAPYSYASGDLLENRNTYFYSVYQGQPFLDAWRTQRAEAQRDTPDSPCMSIPAHAADSIGGSSTDILLDSIHRELTASSRRSGPIAPLDHLLQRFEVSKRLHGEYNDHWRPVDAADYRSLHRYVRFAEVLDLAYHSTGALPYLNALLKVMDTLTAMRSTLNTEQTARLRRLVAREQDHVQRLATGLRGAEHAA